MSEMPAAVARGALEAPGSIPAGRRSRFEVASKEQIGIGLIGYGHWGPNHVRIFNQLPDSRVRVVVDAETRRLEAVHRMYPDVEMGNSYEAVLKNTEVDAVVIATPFSTHHTLVKEALLSGKDVLVEKPIACTSREADELIHLAEEHELVLMCGHVFLYNDGIRKLRQYIEDGILGRIYYIAASRTNLGPVRHDANALYDLGSHDISIFRFLLGGSPREVSAWGQAYLQDDIEDVVFACLEYPNRTLCHMHVSWLNPRKERTLVVVGDKKMVVWDDTSALEPIRLYDKGLMQEPYYDSFGHFQLVVRDADILIPKIKASEPLKVQNQHFLECIRTGERPLTDGAFARDVVLTLEALQRSLRKGGGRERLAT